MAEGGSASPEPGPDTGPAPPNAAAAGPPPPPTSAQVDDSPLQNAMDKNKESLKVKLMLRRPINQLVAQGIMPPLKTPPAFHEQRQKLERAKMGDLLKAKIQQRPDRQELVRQHILEDVGHVDPSLAERQRMLKKARLADSLNDQLSHRPGPLELIKKNILHTEEPIERAVKAGVIPFKATSEGHVTKPQHPDRYITFEEDSRSSEGALSPPQAPRAPHRPDVLEAAAASAGIVTVALTVPAAGGPVVVTSAPRLPVDEAPPPPLLFADLCGGNAVGTGAASLHGVAPALPSPVSVGSTTSSLSPLSSVASPPAPALPLPPRPAPQPSPVAAAAVRSDAPGKDKNRKKSKSKAQPKARTIKFHEYKGPPNAHKAAAAPFGGAMNASTVETSYEILLQQQQLFLQWQLELQHKYPQIILPASQKPLSAEAVAGSPAASASALSGLIAVPSPAAQPPPPTVLLPNTVLPSPPQAAANNCCQDSAHSPTTPTFRTLMKLEDMKVSDLKAELKRRNLPVSGSKPQLIERLKPYSDTSQQHDSQNNQTATIPTCHMTHVIMETQSSAMNEESLPGMSMETPVSPSSQQTSLNVENATVEDDLSLPNLSPKSEAQLSPSSTIASPDAAPVEMDMDTSDCNVVSSSLNSPSQAPASPTQNQTPLSEEIIRDQQRKIEELERELLHSQLQLHKIRCKALNFNVPATPSVKCTTPNKFIAGTTLNAVPNGIVISPDISTKQHQKLILQQHLQQKKQQQHLQQQLQALQQQRQSQQRPATTFQAQQEPESNRVCPSPLSPQSTTRQSTEQGTPQPTPQPQSQSVQRQLEQSLCALQPPQPGLSAKASLAAFLQNQNQQNQQQIVNIFQQQSAASNNKNNCTMISNNKKNTASKSIVLGQQPAAVVLNQINLLQKQKSTPANGIIGHQRTSSLPNFFGSFLSHPQPPEPPVPTLEPAVAEKVTEVICDSTEPHLLITKPPPEYEEATKQLKGKQETSSVSTSAGGTRQKNVKSQMMDDVLEILIKNGELPPSAAQDPGTPTTPGRSLPHGLIFTTSTVSTSTNSTTSTTAPSTTCSSSSSSHKSSSSKHAPTASANVSPGDRGSSSGPSPSTILSPSPPAPPPPPPPPPPLPHSSFSITLPTSITLASSPETTHESNHPSHFPMQFSNAESFEFLLENSENSSNHRSPSQEVPSSSVLNNELQPNPEDDLKELGLDLETLDSMDFGHFGDLCGPVKMPSPHMLETVTDMEIGGSGDTVSENTLGVKMEEMPLHDQLMSHGNGRLGCELMEMGEMPMDMDDPDWLESLMHTDQNAQGSIESSSVMTPPHSSFSIPTSSIQHPTSGYHFTPNNVDLDSYDPLLSNSQDPFDLFNIEDPDFKMSADLNALGWDKVDFAT